jgi:hypothetical protein
MQSTQCGTCKHYLGLRQCDAFPVEIPEDVFSGNRSHRKPHPNDGGIQWEPHEDENDK